MTPPSAVRRSRPNMELGIRVGTTGTNGLLYQGFSATPAGEPFGIHSTDQPLAGVTIRC